MAIAMLPLSFLIAVGKTLLAGYAIFTIAQAYYCESPNFGFVWQIVKRFRFLMLLETLVVMSVTITTIVWLCQMPILNCGWLNLFDMSGNMLTSPIIEGSNSPYVGIRILVPIFFLTLMPLLPFFARYEEWAFRANCFSWRQIVKWSIIFGLVHCIVGVPLGAGLSLSIPGFFFGYKYRQAFLKALSADGVDEKDNCIILGKINIPEGEEEEYLTQQVCEAEQEAILVSTSYHTMYNMIIVGLLVYITTVSI